MNAMRIEVRMVVVACTVLVALVGVACDGLDATSPDEETGYETEGGVVDKETVRTALKAIQPDFQTCYVEASELEPDIQGRVVIGLSLDHAGAEAAILESDIDDNEMMNCLCRAMEEGPFPSADTRVEVKVPFVFRTR